MNNQSRTVFPESKIQLYLVLLAIIQFIGLTFAQGNQVEQFSIVGRILNPSFAEGDFFLNTAAEAGQPRYYYSLIVATLNSLAPLEAVIHSLMLVNGYALALITFIAARHLLHAEEAAAAIAATLVILNHGISLGFAGYLNFSNFQPASLAITASLAGILLLTAHRFISATALFVLALILHPTIGAEVATLGYAAVIITFLVTRQKIQWGIAVVSVFTFLVALVLLWVVPNLSGTGVRLTQTEFFSILIETRAPHHYLGLDFPKRRWLEALLFIIGAGYIAHHCKRYLSSASGLVLLVTLSAFVILLCLSSLFFVDIAESRLWATAQLFRLLFLIKWAAYLVLSLLAFQWLKTAQAHLIILAAIVLLASADATGYAIIAAITTQLAICALRLNRPFDVLATIPAILFTTYHHFAYGSDYQLIRLLIAFSALVLLQIRSRPLAATSTACALVGLCLYVSISSSYIPEKFRTRLTVESRQDDQTKIALLARQISDEDDLWLIPPNLEQFRFIAERAVVVDFTSVPFSDEGLREWHKRMQSLFGKTDLRGFKALNQMLESHKNNPATDIAYDRYNANYAILFTDTHVTAPTVAKAGQYKIISLEN